MHLLPFLPSNSTVIAFVFVCGISWLNWRGLKVVGNVAIAFVIFILLPFVILCAVALPRLHPAEWLIDKPYGSKSMEDIQWLALLNTMVWCLNYWDSAASFAGEVEQPEKAIPAALKGSLIITIANYILPVLACTAALPGQTWATGFWVQAGYELGGHALQWWLFTAALASFSGQFLAGQATCAYELFGMAELGQMPVCFLTRNSNGVPIWSLFLSIFAICVVLLVTNCNLGASMAMANGVYSIAELINYVTFLWLRWRHDNLHRPFRIPLGFVGCVLLLLFPTALCATMIIAPFWTGQWFVAGCILVGASGLLLHSFLGWIRGYFPDAFLEERLSQAMQDQR